MNIRIDPWFGPITDESGRPYQVWAAVDITDGRYEPIAYGDGTNREEALSDLARRGYRDTDFPVWGSA